MLPRATENAVADHRPLTAHPGWT